MVLVEGEGWILGDCREGGKDRLLEREMGRERSVV